MKICFPVIIKLTRKNTTVNIRKKFHRAEELHISRLLMNMVMLLPLLQLSIHSLDLLFFLLKIIFFYSNSFGSMVLGEQTGIIYNNEMDDFSIGDKSNYHGLLASSPLNKISPGKRPLSSQSPLILIDNKENIRLVLGGSGGTKIITSVAQVALLNLIFNQNIKESIDYPRLHHHLSPNRIIYEQTFNQVNIDFHFFKKERKFFFLEYSK